MELISSENALVQKVFLYHFCTKLNQISKNNSKYQSSYNMNLRHPISGLAWVAMFPINAKLPPPRGHPKSRIPLF